MSKTFPFANKITNEVRSQVEVYEFLHDPPDRYFLYISRVPCECGCNSKQIKATTWTGNILGNVHMGKEYTSNFGDRRIPIDVYGINKIWYHGIFYKSAGDYARIKRRKTLPY